MFKSNLSRASYLRQVNRYQKAMGDFLANPPKDPLVREFEEKRLWIYLGFNERMLRRCAERECLGKTPDVSSSVAQNASTSATALPAP